MELFIYYLFSYIQYNQLIKIFFNLNTFFRQNVISYLHMNKTIDLSEEWLFQSLFTEFND